MRMKSSDATLTLPGLKRRAIPAVSFFEYWPDWLFYTPVVMHWIALGLRHGSFTLPTAANPLVPTGGLCGESKTSILDQIGAAERHWVAPYIALRNGTEPTQTLSHAQASLAAAGIAFPLVVKPDIGCNGTGVRLVRAAADLLRAFSEFPPDTALVLQQLIEGPGEAGLFYVRLPGERGRITSLTLKSPPTVIGDGRSTLRALILADPRTGARPQIYLPRLEGRLHEIPASGERVQLVFVGNHCKGSTFANGAASITRELTQRIDAIASAIPEFSFGRFDVRFTTLSELRQGRGFSIIEINGVGSEATHIWDPRTRLIDAYRAQFFHYGAAFRIGAANRARGFAPSSPLNLLRHWREQRRLMASYPLND
jgi:hypothetical protein